MAWFNLIKDPVYLEEVSDGMILRYSLKSIAVAVYQYYGDIDVWNKDLVLAINDEIATYLELLVRDTIHSNSPLYNWQECTKYILEAINGKRRMSHIEEISSLDIDYLTAFCLQHIDSIMTAELNNPLALEWMRNQTRMQVTRNGEYDLMIEGSDYVESI